MILMKQLEAKKRCDEREKKREDMRLRSEREREKRTEQKRLELEVINEMRKPIEDMSLDDHKPLPELKRIPGLRLSGEAFANLLMIYEFLHNFGETLGFDMESLPTMDTLQVETYLSHHFIVTIALSENLRRFTQRIKIYVPSAKIRHA